MRTFQYIVWLLVCLSGGYLQAQGTSGPGYTDKPLRIEIPARSSNETYRIIPCGKNGLILFFRSQEIADASNVKWYFSCYDTNMQQVWVKSVPLLNEIDFRFHQEGSDTLALLFVATGKSRSTENKFEILRVVLNKGTFVLNKGNLQDNAEVAAFGIQHGRAWLGINVKGQAGKIMNIRLKQGNERIFPLGQGDLISVRWLKPDTALPEVAAVVSRQISKKGIENYLVRYDTSGLIKGETFIGLPDSPRSLNHFKVFSPRPGDYLLLGSYGQVATNSSQKNKNPDQSTGFFASVIRNGVQKSISFFNFLELQNANSLLGDQEIMNLKKKATKKNKPLAEYSLDLTLMLQEIINFNEQYILTAEVFSPQYRTENYTDFDYYGRPYTNSYSVFDGYRFANAIIAGFDIDGRLIWDNTLEIRNLVSHELMPKVVVFPDSNDQVLCYITDGKIGSKIIQGNKVVEKLDFASMDLLYPEDKLLSETKSRLIPWYANYFISYGYQEIKNIAIESNNKRLVFYFSKLRFEK